MNNEAKPTKVQSAALIKLADGVGGSNSMRRATNAALHARGWMFRGQITALGLAAIGR